jgi:hypothetical protein
MQAVKDCNGDGISELLLGSPQAQMGLVVLLTLGGASPLDIWRIVPMTADLSWSVQGAADMDFNGCADIVLGMMPSTSTSIPSISRFCSCPREDC